jgi:hypothetical protein
MVMQLAGWATMNSYGALGLEKFTFRISARHTEGTLRLTPVVEVKQVLYTTPVDPHAIWETNQFALLFEYGPRRPWAAMLVLALFGRKFRCSTGG